MQCVKENEAAWHAAVAADLCVERNQVFLRATALVYNELSEALRELDHWMSPERPSVPLLHRFDGVAVQPEPKGTVLIIGAWNYPMQLVLAPLVGALAAGCCAVLKPRFVFAGFFIFFFKKKGFQVCYFCASDCG